MPPMRPFKKQLESDEAMKAMKWIDAIALAAVLTIAAAPALAAGGNVPGNCGLGSGSGNASCVGGGTGSGGEGSGGQRGSVANNANTYNATSTSTSNASQQISVGGNTYLAPQRAAASAIAPAFSMTTTCAIAGGVSVQCLSFGVSAGKSTIDENCAAIEAAKAVFQLGKPDAAHEVLCALAAVRQARQRAQDPCAEDRPRPALIDQYLE